MGQLQWVNQWGTAADERVWELEFAPNGSVWAAEAKGGWGAETAIHLVKFDVCGNECRRFEVVTGRFDFVFVRDFHIDEFGFLFLTATPRPYGTSFVGMYDDCGREYWSHTIAEANASIHLMGIATNRCGQVFVVGTRQNSRGFSYGPVLYEFDYRGCQKNRSLVEQYGHLNRVSVDSEGRPFAAGWGWGSEEARPDDEALRPLILPELAATPDDIAPAARGVTPLMIRFNRNGSVNWLHKARKSALSHPYAFDVDQPDGGLLVGFARTPESNDDGYAATVQISSGIGWRKIPQETRNGHDGTTDRQGGLFVTGATEDGQSVNGQPNAGKNDVYVIKYRRQ